MNHQPTLPYLSPSTLTLAQENALRQLCDVYKKLGDDAADYAGEILDILDNPHEGDPAYDEPDEMPYERTGSGQGYW